MHGQLLLEENGQYSFSIRPALQLCSARALASSRGRRQISSDYVLRSIDGRHMCVAAAIETFVTNKAGDAGSSCKAEHFACACSWPRRSCRVSRGQDGRPKGKLLQASGRCHEQSTNNGGDVCNRTTVQIVGDSRFRLGSPNDRPAGACRHKGKTLMSF